MRLKSWVKSIPVLGGVAKKIKEVIFPRKPFETSDKYWENRYRKGGSSGSGSYKQLAEFKGEIINRFVREHKVGTVIEFGCGDGNQLRYFEFSSYIGYDISQTVIRKCSKLFGVDPSKQFRLMKDFKHQTVDLTLSLDVIYHLVEDDYYADYISKLFDSSHKFVIIYSSNKSGVDGKHVRHRVFTEWVEAHRPAFKQIQFVRNPYPFNGDVQSSSFADFYIFQKVNG